MTGFDELDVRVRERDKHLPGVWFEQQGEQWCHFLIRGRWRRISKLSCIYLRLLGGSS